MVVRWPMFVFVLMIAILVRAQFRVDVARRYVNENAVPELTVSDVGTLSGLALARDPETSITSYVHGIRRNAKDLLSQTQTQQWEQLIAKRSPQLRQLHDERNVLRAYYFACAWQLPLAKPGQGKAAKREELMQWLDVWMQIRMLEQIAHHRYCRDAWALLRKEQLESLKLGEWDVFVKKSTGHKRTYYSDRIVIRALGEPDKESEFNDASAKFEGAHAAIRKTLLDAEVSWRRAAFVIPSLEDQQIVQAWMPVDAAYRQFFLAQARHIEELTQAGYDTDDSRLRELLIAQTKKEFSDLDDKIQTKLMAGKHLRELIEAKTVAQ